MCTVRVGQTAIMPDEISTFETTTYSDAITKIESSLYNQYDIIQYYMKLYAYPILCVFGVCGNVLSLCVMTQGEMKKSSII